MFKSPGAFFVEGSPDGGVVVVVVVVAVEVVLNHLCLRATHPKLHPSYLGADRL